TPRRRTRSAATRLTLCWRRCRRRDGCGRRLVPDPTADYLALRQEVGAVWLPRDAVLVHGPDAFSYLQGQLSQELEGLPVGGATWTFLLEPTGKVVAWLRLVPTADDAVRLDLDRGWDEAFAER